MSKCPGAVEHRGQGSHGGHGARDCGCGWHGSIKPIKRKRLWIFMVNSEHFHQNGHMIYQILSL